MWRWWQNRAVKVEKCCDRVGEPRYWTMNGQSGKFWRYENDFFLRFCISQSPWTAVITLKIKTLCCMCANFYSGEPLKDELHYSQSTDCDPENNLSNVTRTFHLPYEMKLFSNECLIGHHIRVSISSQVVRVRMYLKIFKTFAIYFFKALNL